jgi:hypothetical protein
LPVKPQDRPQHPASPPAQRETPTQAAAPAGADAPAASVPPTDQTSPAPGVVEAAQVAHAHDGPHPEHLPPGVHVTSLFEDLDTLSASVTAPISLGELEESMRGRGAALLMLILCMPFMLPVSIPGVSTVCSAPIALFGLQFLLGLDPRLPGFLRRKKLSPDAVRGVAVGARRVLKPIAFLFRPRFAIMFWQVPWRLMGLGMFVSAVVLALPVPLPFANFIPAAAILVFSFGIVQRDGVAIIAAYGILLGAFIYMWLVWETVVAVFQKIFA